MSRNLIVLLGGLFLISACAKPVARFSIGDSNKKRYAPSKIKFSNESEKADKYIWDFGDGNTSEKESPVHQYDLSGKYTVVLTAIKGNKKSMEERDVFITAPEECLVKIETSMGDMVIRLSGKTPKHRENFLELAEEGYYEDLLFHRVINGFMIQGGDPNSKNASPEARLGTGGPGYEIRAEIVEGLAHVKGALAAARKGDGVNPEKKSSGSQFYIVHGNSVSENQLDKMEMTKGIVYSDELRKMYTELGGTPFLDNEYTVFGMVIEGMDVIDAIAGVETAPGDRPKKDVKILKVSVIK